MKASSHYKEVTTALDVAVGNKTFVESQRAYRDHWKVNIKPDMSKENASMHVGEPKKYGHKYWSEMELPTIYIWVSVLSSYLDEFTCFIVKKRCGFSQALLIIFTIKKTKPSCVRRRYIEFLCSF